MNGNFMTRNEIELNFKKIPSRNSRVFLPLFENTNFIISITLFYLLFARAAIFSLLSNFVRNKLLRWNCENLQTKVQSCFHSLISSMTVIVICKKGHV